MNKEMAVIQAFVQLKRAQCVEMYGNKGVVMEADTIVTFEGSLDKDMNRMGIEGYGLRKSRGF